MVSKKPKHALPLFQFFLLFQRLFSNIYLHKSGTLTLNSPLVDHLLSLLFTFYVFLKKF